MYDAISNNKPDFVEIFMENDCDISKFLTYRQLLNLYNEVNKDKINFNFNFNMCVKKSKIDA